MNHQVLVAKSHHYSRSHCQHNRPNHKVHMLQGECTFRSTLKKNSSIYNISRSLLAERCNISKESCMKVYDRPTSDFLYVLDRMWATRVSPLPRRQHSTHYIDLCVYQFTDEGEVSGGTGDVVGRTTLCWMMTHLTFCIDTQRAMFVIHRGKWPPSL